MELLGTAINAAVIAVIGVAMTWLAKGKFDAADARIDRLEGGLTARMDRLEGGLTDRMDRLEAGLTVGSTGSRDGWTAGSTRSRPRPTGCART